MPPPDTRSTWSPLRHTIFRWLWIASVASNIGTWFQNVGASWMMTTLSPSPVLVALVQAATSLPMFLLSLPAGAVADVLDRRRLLLVTQTWMTLAAFGLWAFTAAHATTPSILLSFTFLLGLGAALNGPAWQASIPEMVPREDLPAAVTLGSIGFNIARAAGPALAGLVVATAGPAVTFLVNALSFVGVLVVLYFWRRPVEEAMLPAERIWGAMTTGLRYVRHAPEVIAPIVRGCTFVFCGASLGPFCRWSPATGSRRVRKAMACCSRRSARVLWQAPWPSLTSSGTTRWTPWWRWRPWSSPEPRSRSPMCRRSGC